MKKGCSSGCARRLWKGAAVLALLIACSSETALAAQYTRQEKANIQLVREFYAALDAADAKGVMSHAVVGIAAKYIASTYKQHAFGAQSGRENFVKMFQGMGSKPPAMEPEKIITLMADGDLVIRLTRRGSTLLWNMFRIQHGQLAEHWELAMNDAARGAGG